MVLLDVVYNHFGPDGAYIHAYAKQFFREDVHTPWGAAIDFRRAEVRDYFIQNALYWLEEYRFDGLRFDAVHAISEEDFLHDLAARYARGRSSRAATSTWCWSTRTTAPPSCVRPRRLRRAMGRRLAPLPARAADRRARGLLRGLPGRDQPARRCLAEGFAYQGEIAPHLGRPRGEPSGHLPTTAFVVCLQNHDQIGNRAMGERLTTLADPGALRAATALLLLTPVHPDAVHGRGMGQHLALPVLHQPQRRAGQAGRDGRRDEFKHFAAFQDEARRDRIPDPNAPTTFEAPARSARTRAHAAWMARCWTCGGSTSCRACPAAAAWAPTSWPRARCAPHGAWAPARP